MRAAHRRVQHPPGNVRDHELGLVLADHAHDIAAQLEVRRKMPVLVAEELDLLDAQDFGRGLLLPLPDRHELGVLLRGVLPTLRPVRDDHVRHLGAAVGQAGNRAPGAKVRVVGMGGDDHHPLELRKPAVAA